MSASMPARLCSAEQNRQSFRAFRNFQQAQAQVAGSSRQELPARLRMVRFA